MESESDTVTAFLGRASELNHRLHNLTPKRRDADARLQEKKAAYADLKRQAIAVKLEARAIKEQVDAFDKEIVHIREEVRQWMEYNSTGQFTANAGPPASGHVDKRASRETKSVDLAVTPADSADFTTRRMRNEPGQATAGSVADIPTPRESEDANEVEYIHPIEIADDSESASDEWLPIKPSSGSRRISSRPEGGISQYFPSIHAASPMVISIHGCWKAVFCPYCGANASRQLSRVLNGIISLLHHMRIQHRDEGDFDLERVVHECKKFDISEEDIERLKDGHVLSWLNYQWWGQPSKMVKLPVSDKHMGDLDPANASGRPYKKRCLDNSPQSEPKRNAHSAIEHAIQTPSAPKATSNN